MAKRAYVTLALIGLIGNLFIGILFVFPARAGEDLKGTVTLSGAWAIYPTAVAWADAFMKRHPGVRIEVSAGGAGKGAADAIAGLVDIGMVSRDPDPSELKRGVTPIYVLHDAVYPVVSDKNPVLDDLLKKGVSRKTFVGIYITGRVTTWDKVAGRKAGKSIQLYTRADSCGAAASWAKFIGGKQEDLKGIGVYGDPGLLETVRRDPLGIGYNNFSYVFTRTGALARGIRLVPIDANGNGKADPDEIFTDRAEAVEAIKSGRYPATRKNFFFVKGKPKGLVREFIRFALSEEGTKIVDEVGTSLPVPEKDRERGLAGLD